MQLTLSLSFSLFIVSVLFFLFAFNFSALSITYSNPHTKACYFIIKHLPCVTTPRENIFYFYFVFLLLLSVMGNVFAQILLHFFLFHIFLCLWNIISEWDLVSLQCLKVWALYSLFFYVFVGFVISLRLEFWSSFVLLLLSFFLPLPLLHIVYLYVNEQYYSNAYVKFLRMLWKRAQEWTAANNFFGME